MSEMKQLKVLVETATMAMVGMAIADSPLQDSEIKAIDSMLETLTKRPFGADALRSIAQTQIANNYNALAYVQEAAGHLPQDYRESVIGLTYLVMRSDGCPVSQVEQDLLMDYARVLEVSEEKVQAIIDATNQSAMQFASQWGISVSDEDPSPDAVQDQALADPGPVPDHLQPASRIALLAMIGPATLVEKVATSDLMMIDVSLYELNGDRVDESTLRQLVAHHRGNILSLLKIVETWAKEADLDIATLGKILLAVHSMGLFVRASTSTMKVYFTQCSKALGLEDNPAHAAYKEPIKELTRMLDALNQSGKR